MTTTFSERLIGRLANRPAGPKWSRRRIFGGAAIIGAALVTDPWGFLTRPVSAYDAVCGSSATCAGGYSVFCCTINDGKNACPPHTFVGGWWKADRSSFCGGKARYYIDCNAVPGYHFECRCNTKTCDQRLTACNVFRYGQCSPDIAGVTPVVCRQISCRPPWEIYPGVCGRASATDNNTASHTAPCLTTENTFPLLVTFPKAAKRLAAGRTLGSGQRLTAANRRSTIVMQPDGDLAVLTSAGEQWTSGTRGAAKGGHAQLSASGNLTVFDRNGNRVWSTGTAGTAAMGSAPELRIRNDGQVVIHNGQRIVWSTHTRSKA